MKRVCPFRNISINIMLEDIIDKLDCHLPTQPPPSLPLPSLFCSVSFSPFLSFFLYMYTCISLCHVFTMLLSLVPFLSLSLSVSLSHTHTHISLSLSLIMCVTFCLYHCISLSSLVTFMYVSFSLSVCLSVCLPASLSLSHSLI